MYTTEGRRLVRGAAELTRRTTSALRRHGLGGFGRRVLRRLGPVPRWAAVWIWYELDLTAVRPAPGAGSRDLELRRAGADDLGVLDRLPPDSWVSYMTRDIGARWIRDGGTLWLASIGGSPAMVCWTFTGQAPLHGARRGRVVLPADVVFVEDVLTWPAFRGRGVASSVLASIAADHALSGARTLVTRVQVPNVVSRRLFERLGFREVARMQIVKRDWRTRIRVAFPDGAPERPWLAALTRG